MRRTSVRVHVPRVHPGQARVLARRHHVLVDIREKVAHPLRTVSGWPAAYRLCESIVRVAGRTADILAKTASLARKIGGAPRVLSNSLSQVLISGMMPGE